MKIQAQGAMRYVSDFGVWIWKLRKTLKKKIIIIIVTMIKQTLLKALKFVRLQKLSLVNVHFGLF